MRIDRLTSTPLADAVLAETPIYGLTADSRAVQPGYLFAALSGSLADGRNYVGQAIENGAAAILTDAPMVAGVPVLTHDNPRQELALMAARFFEVQPPHIAAVTGTNGKTSTVAFLRQLLGACDLQAAAMGTLGIETDGYFEPLAHTTPEPVRLHAALRDLVAHQVTHVAMEASSHGLAQYRLDGVKLEIAGFTNLSRDHMDYHSSPEDYAAAKQRLFTEVLSENGTAIVVMTHEAGAAMAEAARTAGRAVIPVGRSQDNVFVEIKDRSAIGLTLAVTLNGETQNFDVPLIGDFQIENLSLALGMAQAFGLDDAALFAACRMVQPPRGRMHFVGRTEKGAAVYVDYAHTPDALENALTALRAHLPSGGHLSVMFGCGGNRDAGKRPLMGSVAAQHADKIIITDDNPRHEDAAAIRSEILSACEAAQEIADRRQAIETALVDAAGDDIVLLAGKGHESGQIIGDKILPFDDIGEAQRCLATQAVNRAGGAHG